MWICNAILPQLSLTLGRFTPKISHVELKRLGLLLSQSFGCGLIPEGYDFEGVNSEAKAHPLISEAICPQVE